MSWLAVSVMALWWRIEGEPTALSEKWRMTARDGHL
jgi:hypothetical protein